MKENIHLDILVEGGVITVAARRLTEIFIDRLEEKVTLNWADESSSMFVTHLAAAIERMLKHEAVTTVTDVMRVEMNLTNPSYIMSAELMSFLQEQSESTLQCSEEEIMLIAMYITLLSQ